MAASTTAKYRGGSKKRTKPRNRPAPPATEEEVYAYYIQTDSWTRTSEQFGMPVSTVFGLVHRLMGDEKIEKDRNSLRALLARNAMMRIAALIDHAVASDMGTERSSRGSEAARAAADLGRVLQSIEPKKDAELVIPEINVYTGIAPPSEEEALPAPAVGPDGKVTIQ